MKNKTGLVLVGILFGFGLTAFAQSPRLTNAQLTSRPATAGLSGIIQTLVSEQSPAWIGYRVPMIPGEHNLCCYGFRNGRRMSGGCRLEETGGTNMQSSGKEVLPESGESLLVLLRAEAGRLQKILLFTEECVLDGGGLPLYWLTDVGAAESISFLSRFATGAEGDARTGRNLSDSAIFAIAFHKDPAADRELERFVAPGQPDSLRERTSFWLGNARGRRGYEILSRLVREDSSERVREQAVFALAQSKEPEAVRAIIEVAKADRSTRVRSQALFWLSWKAGEESAKAITDAIENDPETEVKKAAVFALFQLPKDAGVPRLIEVARTNRNPAVRKQAMFWLGQSKDPRALAFFERILK